MENAKIAEILRSSGFRFNKALGQNFIFDANLLAAIAADSGVGKADTVVEIGTGAGTLTAKLAERAARVFSFEVDERLKPVLDLTLRGIDNVEVVFRDIMKMRDGEVQDVIGDGEFSVVANLPYYITTPLIMRRGDHARGGQADVPPGSQCGQRGGAYIARSGQSCAGGRRVREKSGACGVRDAAQNVSQQPFRRVRDVQGEGGGTDNGVRFFRRRARRAALP